MSEGQIRKLFAELKRLAIATEGQNAETKKVVAEAIVEVQEAAKQAERAAKKVEVVLVGYQEHGGAIEHIRLSVEKLRLRCPLLGSQEYPAVCAGKEDGACPGGDS